MNKLQDQSRKLPIGYLFTLMILVLPSLSRKVPHMSSGSHCIAVVPTNNGLLLEMIAPQLPTSTTDKGVFGTHPLVSLYLSVLSSRGYRWKIDWPRDGRYQWWSHYQLDLSPESIDVLGFLFHSTSLTWIPKDLIQYYLESMKNSKLSQDHQEVTVAKFNWFHITPDMSPLVECWNQLTRLWVIPSQVKSSPNHHQSNKNVQAAQIVKTHTKKLNHQQQSSSFSLHRVISQTGFHRTLDYTLIEAVRSGSQIGQNRKVNLKMTDILPQAAYIEGDRLPVEVTIQYYEQSGQDRQDGTESVDKKQSDHQHQSVNKKSTSRKIITQSTTLTIVPGERVDLEKPEWIAKQEAYVLNINITHPPSQTKKVYSLIKYKFKTPLHFRYQRTSSKKTQEQDETDDEVDSILHYAPPLNRYHSDEEYVYIMMVGPVWAEVNIISGHNSLLPVGKYLDKLARNHTNPYWKLTNGSHCYFAYYLRLIAGCYDIGQNDMKLGVNSALYLSISIQRVNLIDSCIETHLNQIKLDRG